MFMPEVWILWSKKKNFCYYFQKENGNTFTLLIIFIVKSLQKEQNSTNLLLRPPIHPGINLQSPQSDSTLWTLTLGRELIIRLARHLAKGYKGLDQEIVSLFSAANIYLFPMVDYEYFDTSNEGNCSSFFWQNTRISALSARIFFSYQNARYSCRLSHLTIFFWLELKVIAPTVLTRVWAEKLAPSLDVRSICIEQEREESLKKSRPSSTFWKATIFMWVFLWKAKASLFACLTMTKAATANKGLGTPAPRKT